MNRQISKRNRSVVLTREGWQKFQKAKLEQELQEKSGSKYTIEEISEFAELAPNTVAKILGRQQGVDRRTLVNLFMAFNIELSPQDYCKLNPDLPNFEDLINPKHIDWGEAVDVSVFYGREAELAVLSEWIIEQNCRVIAILGMGGIGKTSLAAKLVEQIQIEFDYIIWRSLYNSPPLFELLASLIQFFSDYQVSETELPKSIDSRILQLINYLQQHRCLIILDNVETILQSGAIAGDYSEGYEGYGQLIQRLGEISHQSCLLLTSREKPKQVASLEGLALPIRSLQLKGLSKEDGKKIFQLKGLCREDFKERELIELYCGNPLALKIIATTIQDVFNGNIAEFLKERTLIFGDIQAVLEKQFDRLSNLEPEVIYWLAINHEPITLHQLQEDFISPLRPQKLLEVLESLVRRSFIDKSEQTLSEQNTVSFKLHPLLLEFVTSKLVKQVCQEIATQEIVLLRSHSLLKAQCKDCTKETQIRLILKPVIDEILSIFKTPKSVENHLSQIITKLHKESPLEPGYAGGNILNLLCQLKTDLRGYDFSDLTVWQADLRGVNLSEVKFRNANLLKSLFTKDFSRVCAIAFSPNGTTLAASDANGKVCFWREFANAEQVLTCLGHMSWVHAIAFSPDGRTLASGGSDQNVKLWDVNTGKCVKILTEHHERITSIAFSPRGKILAFGSDDQTVHLLSVTTGETYKILRQHTGQVLSVAFSPKGNILASASSDTTVKLWNLSTGECLKTLDGHTSAVWSVAFSPNGQILASSGDDQTVRLWNVMTGECMRISQGHSDRVRSVAFAREGKILASGSDDQTVKLWDTSTGECLRTLEGHTGLIWSVAFGSEGHILASGSDDKTVRLWNVSTGQALRILQGYNNGVHSVAFAPEGNSVVSCNDDQTVKLWDVGSGECLRTLERHSNRVRTVAYSRDGKILATGCYDQLVRLWDTNSGQCSKILRGHTGWIKSVGFAPEGHILASGSDDKTVKLWDVNTGDILKTLEHSHGVWSVAFSPDGHMLASGSDDKTVKLWNVNSGECLKTFAGHMGWVLSVAFSPEGEILASGSKDKTVKLWNVSSGECLKTFAGHMGWVLSVAFSPIPSSSGGILASGSTDTMVKLWDFISGRCINTLYGHDHWIRSVSFSPDGRTMVSGSEDQTIKLWNVVSGECLKTLRNEKPYQGMDITAVTGLSDATIASLKVLGAIQV